MMTDPIADMLTRIRNAQMARNKMAEIPFSKVKAFIADILVAEKYVEKVEKVDGRPAKLMVTLKYFGKEPAIRSITRVSKPGHRKYIKSTEVPRVLNDYGIAIISTSQGLMTNKEARKLGIGGELICSIY